MWLKSPCGVAQDSSGAAPSSCFGRRSCSPQRFGLPLRVLLLSGALTWGAGAAAWARRWELLGSARGLLVRAAGAVCGMWPSPRHCCTCSGVCRGVCALGSSATKPPSPAGAGAWSACSASVPSVCVFTCWNQSIDIFASPSSSAAAPANVTEGTVSYSPRGSLGVSISSPSLSSEFSVVLKQVFAAGFKTDLVFL